ncbi:hypothetical protein [uncultured Ruegeria sp.]|uniref:hypothetical protein n=1 Tax=uncultured Ruegeria sp. TaxID=259304 RepID=UPI002637C800|nr:hypothetical protein [uncultured Ruegeria sp.]
MSDVFLIKEGDTSPAIRYQLSLADGQTLVGASASFKVKNINGDVLKVDASADIDTVENILTYSWITADTDTAGTYLAEFEVTYADSKIETFPNEGFIMIEVGADLD